MKEKVWVQIGAKIKRERLARGMMQKYLAEKAEVTPQMLCDIEYHRRLPSAETVGKIAYVFGMTVDDLLSDVTISKFGRVWILMPE